MSYNRRLAVQEQPPGEFTFTPDNLKWAKEQVKKYPEGRQASAIIPLLWRAHEQNGNWLSRAAIEYVAGLLGMPYIRALEVATFYTMFQLKPVGKKAHIQVCGTTPCMLRGSEALMEVCKKRIHPDQFYLSKDGAFSWEEVECAGACVNAPMVQIGADTFEDLTPEILNKLIDDIAAGKKTKPGPQIVRQFSEPFGGATSLLDTPHPPRSARHPLPQGEREELTSPLEREVDRLSGSEAGRVRGEKALADARAKKPTKSASQDAEPAPHAAVKEAERKGKQKGD
jgi:NADH-quinone oxidoreductase subunit E